MNDFEDVELNIGDNVIAATGWRFFGKVYAVITWNTMIVLGSIGTYETMFFIDGQSVSFDFLVPPFRYDTIDEARGKHQCIVTQIKKELRNRAKSLI